MMAVLSGLFLHLLGGVASGSFYVPLGYTEKWSWESSWLVAGLFSWLLVPPIFAYFTLPGFSEVIQRSDPHTRAVVFLLGACWGVGSVFYGLGIRYLGMSLGNSYILGISSVCGSLMPALYYDHHPTEGKVSFRMLLHSSGGKVVLFGMAVALFGIYLCGKAGVLKEKEQQQQQQRARKKSSSSRVSILQQTGGADDAGANGNGSTSSDGFNDSIDARNSGEDEEGGSNFWFGLGVATISGFTSAFMNFGIEAGKPLADECIARGMPPLFQNNVIYVLLLWGGLSTNALYCIGLNLKNGSCGDYVHTRVTVENGSGSTRMIPIAKNYGWCALAGTTWFLQFFFYGMGESKLGNGASSWILHMTFIILTANGWGFYLKEWDVGIVEASTRGTMIRGVATLLLSVLIVGMGNSLDY